MTRCLCCNKIISNPNAYETAVSWHKKCIRSFFGTDVIPELDCSETELERLANLTVNKGLTVPGVQKKLSLHLESTDRIARFTVVDHPAGFILKPPAEDYPCMPEAEFLSMKMAQKAGIRTVPHALLSVNGRIAYITRRIDRTNGRMYAMEDFCQLSGRMTADKYRSSYENCGSVIKRYSENIGLDLAELYYRLLFCFVIGNSDMHLKNFSLIERESSGRNFVLSAAYDMLPVNVIMPADTEETALSLNGKKRNLKRNDFRSLAVNLGIPDKTADRLTARIVSLKDDLADEVTMSYITDSMKAELKELIEKRTGVLE